MGVLGCTRERTANFGEIHAAIADPLSIHGPCSGPRSDWWASLGVAGAEETGSEVSSCRRCDIGEDLNGIRSEWSVIATFNSGCISVKGKQLGLGRALGNNKLARDGSLAQPEASWPKIMGCGTVSGGLWSVL